MTEPRQHLCYSCVAIFGVSTDGRPDLVVRFCPFCGGESIPPDPPEET